MRLLSAYSDFHMTFESTGLSARFRYSRPIGCFAQKEAHVTNSSASFVPGRYMRCASSAPPLLARYPRFFYASDFFCPSCKGFSCGFESSEANFI